MEKVTQATKAMDELIRVTISSTSGEEVLSVKPQSSVKELKQRIKDSRLGSQIQAGKRKFISLIK